MLSDQNKELIVNFFSDKPVKKAYIFGSVVRNTETEDSDIDVLVDLDYANGAGYAVFMNMQRQLSQLLNKKVDLVSSNGISKHILPIIEAEKVIIYMKQNER